MTWAGNDNKAVFSQLLHTVLNLTGGFFNQAVNRLLLWTLDVSLLGLAPRSLLQVTYLKLLSGQDLPPLLLSDGVGARLIS